MVQKIKTKIIMVSIKKLVYSLAIVMFVGVGFSSCDKKSDDIQVPDSPNEKVSVDQKSTVKTFSASALRTFNFDEVYEVDLSDYTHVYQQGVYGMCGPCTYVSARSIKNPSYSATYDAAASVKSTLDSLYGQGRWGVYQLYCYRDRTSKDWGRWRSANNMWTSARNSAKTWIKEKISQGKPCVIPCLYNMSTSTASTGHFYVIVSLYLTNDGFGSIVGVKDVWRNSSETLYFSYTDLLSSNWVNSQKFAGSGQEHYALMSFE